MSNREIAEKLVETVEENLYDENGDIDRSSQDYRQLAAAYGHLATGIKQAGNDRPADADWSFGQVYLALQSHAADALTSDELNQIAALAR